jgi:catechol 2,3-dioxygenase-like lactoylglutathione lyase family enzyme
LKGTDHGDGVRREDAGRRGRREIPVKVRKIGFVGTRTDRPEAMAAFFEHVLGLEPTHSGDDMWAFRLPDGSVAEVFGSSLNEHLTTGPVAEFQVEDVEAATQELRRAGVQIVFGPQRSEEAGLAWTHFRAPDGNVYGVIEDLRSSG